LGPTKRTGVKLDVFWGILLKKSEKGDVGNEKKGFTRKKEEVRPAIQGGVSGQ